MKRNNSFQISIWSMLLSVGLTAAMAIPNLDPSGMRAPALTDTETESDDLVTLSSEIEFPKQESDAPLFSPEEVSPKEEITATLQSTPVSLEPAIEDVSQIQQHSTSEIPVRNASEQRQLYPENDKPTTVNFNSDRIETQLRELMEKVDRLEQTQIQQQDFFLDKSTYLIHHRQLFTQLEALEHRLESFQFPATVSDPLFPFAEEIAEASPLYHEQQATPHAPDFKQPHAYLQEDSGLPRISPGNFHTQRNSFSVERFENESSMDTASEMRIIPSNDAQ